MEKPIRAIEGKCLHYNGTVNDKCEAGINYKELAGGTKGALFDVLPCFGKGKPCEKSCEKKLLPTTEQVSEWKKYTSARFTHIIHAIAIVSEQNNADKKGRGHVVCPACSGKLHYTVSSYNRHIHGACETQECLQWMQ